VRQLHLIDSEAERTLEERSKGLAALADCKREVKKTPAPVARARSNWITPFMNEKTPFQKAFPK
jgi:hypothetical protein